MKELELSTEQKAKAYDEALKRARKELQACGSTDCDAARQIFRFFPELEESKDERIRKEIIETFKNLGDGKIPVDINYADIFTWLEKQEGCEYIKKDWLEHIKQSWYKEGFIDGKYSGGTSKEDETKMRAALAFIKSEFPKKGDEEIMEDTIEWLKSFKTHKTWKPSEEQMDALADALSLAKNCGEECAFDLRTLLEQLKNL